MANLSTKYMGLELKNPIIIGSSGLTDSVEGIKKLAENNAGAVVLKSLFEEQIVMDSHKNMDQSEMDYPEAYDYISGYTKGASLDKYLELIKEAKKAVDIPIIASINCVTDFDWTLFASKIEVAGADALELNVAIMPSDFKINGETNEKRYFSIVEKVRKHVSIPISLKMSHYSAGLAKLIMQLSYTGNIDAFVLFNRYYRPDIDIETLKVVSAGTYSSPAEISTSLRWIALLSGSISDDLAASTGVHDYTGVIKQVLAGASAVQITSAIYEKGPEYINEILKGVESWMDKKGFTDIGEIKGRVNYDQAVNPAAFERTQFMKYYSNI